MHKIVIWIKKYLGWLIWGEIVKTELRRKLGRYPFFNFSMNNIRVWWAKSVKNSTTELIYYTDFASPYGLKLFIVHQLLALSPLYYLPPLNINIET